MLSWSSRAPKQVRRQRDPKSAPFRPAVEALEDRCLLAANVLQTNLVSDLPGVAQSLDPQLVNPWGIAESTTSPFWVSDNNAGVSTLYNTSGTKQGLVVSIPAPGAPLGSDGTPTGTVFNLDGGPTGGFKVSGFTRTGAPTSAAAVFLFVTEDGTVVGWNPGVNPAGFDPTKAGTYGIIAVDHSGNNFTEPDPLKQTGAVYKGLAIAPVSATPIIPTDANSTSLLYASNFRSGKIDVFDTTFAPVTPAAGAFTDPHLPKGYAPFNVQVLGGKLYVTYAKQDDARHDDVAGQGRGIVDTYNLDGSGEQRLVSHGQLDSPWGLAIAPASFGSLAGALLVGNFGNGRINAYNATTGEFLTNLKDPDGEPIEIDGLWALRVGNGGNGGNANLVYFTAGLDSEQHGLFGSLTSVAAGTPEGPAEQQAVQAAIDIVQLNLATVQQDIAGGVTGAELTQAIQDLNQSLVDLARAEIRFAADAHSDAGQGGGHDGSHNHDGLDVQGLDALFRQLDKLGWDGR